MALENDIQELTAEIRSLIETLKATNISPTQNVLKTTAGSSEVNSDAKQGAVVKETAAKKDKAATTPKSSQASAPTIESSSDESESPVIEYAALQTAVLDVSKKSRATPKDSREQAVALLARFGVAGISKLLPEQYADVMALCPKIMSGELDMTAAIIED